MFPDMRACPSCGLPIDRRNQPAVCPKCDEDLIRAKARKPLVVDLAHRGETVSQALAKLDAAVSECVWHGHSSLKVIHGHGPVTGKAGRIVGRRITPASGPEDRSGIVRSRLRWRVHSKN